METFITTICTDSGTGTITCDYGGVLLYAILLLIITTFISFAFWGTYKIITKLI